MGLFDLVEEDHLVRPAAHRLGQAAALLIADIAGRGADQPRDRVLLHVFRHVDAHHRALVVEQKRGERLGQFGLADAGRPEEQERADRPVRVLQAGARPAHRLRDRGDRLVLADDAGFEGVFHVQQLAALAFEHLFDRHAGPARDDRGDLLGGDRLLAHHAAPLFGLGLGEPLFEVGDDAVGELAGARPVAAALHLLQFDARLLQLLLQFLRAGELLLLGLPLRGQFGRLLLELGQFLLEPLQALARGRVGLLLQRLALDLQLHDAAVELVQFLGLRVDRHAQPRRGLVHQVDRLVGQKAVGDVAVGEGRRGDDRAVGDAHAVVQFVFLLDAAQDRDRVLDRGLADIDRLEAPFERGVLLDVLAVFVQVSSRRRNAIRRAPRRV